MRKFLIFLVSLLLVSRIQSQVMLTVQLPPQGVTIKSQLWNFTLINTSEDIKVKMEIVVTDASNNLQVFTGVTRVFNLPKGTRQFRFTDVMPVNYNIVNPGYGVDPNPDGFLPIGVFNVCYSVIKVINDAFEPLTEECEVIDIEPISPPQLLTPVDSEYVEVTRPFFTWLPPAPINLFNALNYDWVLVEVMNMQSGAEAVQQNIPLYQQINLKSTNYQLPISGMELDTGKVYAWRVVAKNGSSSVANSEVWTFRIIKRFANTPAKIVAGSYAKLRREEDGTMITCYGKVQYEYLNEINSSSLQVRLFDLSSQTRKQITLESSTQQIKYGQNFIDLDLSDITGMKSGRIYLLELINAKGEKWYLKFQYRAIE